MHEVRVHYNLDEGTQWWAEDDLGFNGGSDDLSELLDAIQEWAELEGVVGDLAIRLVSETENPHDDVVVRFAQRTRQAPSTPSPRPPISFEPLTSGAETVRVGFSLVPA